MSPLGIVQHSYTEAWRPNSGSKFNNALTFLEYSASIGAAGVQVGIRPDEHPNVEKIRARAETLGVFYEGNVSLPRNDAGLETFEANLKAAATAGAVLVRTAQFKLAFENHKDWLIAEQIEILRKLSSEWIGCTVDTGNSIALLENPYEVVETMAPFAFSTHIKDMALREYDQGFLLSEVVLGSGYLDIPRMIATVRKANPKIRLILEMITRDPLKIPCLTDYYYATFENRNAFALANSLAQVKVHRSEKVPETTGLNSTQRAAFEDQNVRDCLKWAEGKFTA